MNVGRSAAGGGPVMWRSYITKENPGFKQGLRFAWLYSARPCPVSLPGHAVLQECGHRRLIRRAGVGGEIKNKKKAGRLEIRGTDVIM